MGIFLSCRRRRRDELLIDVSRRWQSLVHRYVSLIQGVATQQVRFILSSRYLRALSRPVLDSATRARRLGLV